MEALLNFVWLFASLTLLGAGMLHYCARSDRRHAKWLIIVALAAIAVLLFPVISCTDDLNPTLFASEDLSRRHMWSSVAHAPSHQLVLPMVTLLALLFAIVLLVIGQLAPSSERRSASAGFLRACAGRAPPVLA